MIARRASSLTAVGEHFTGVALLAVAGSWCRVAGTRLYWRGRGRLSAAASHGGGTSHILGTNTDRLGRRIIEIGEKLAVAQERLLGRLPAGQRSHHHDPDQK